MELNKYIDFTNLKMDACCDDIERLCKDAIKYNFETVCVHPYYVPFVSKLLEDSNVGVCTVVGFPLGMNTPKVKVFEAIDAAENGADEIDMVVNIGALKDKDYDYIKSEIEEVRDSIDGAVLKIIIETSLLTKEEIVKMTEICNETFVNFIKTSTGFGSRGASLEDINIINSVKNDILEVKASGGIRSYSQAKSFLDLGVTRLGTSSGVSIMLHQCECDDCHCDDCHCEEDK